MWLTSWLRKRTTVHSSTARRTNAKPRFRLTLEALEDRSVPSTLSVTTALDVVDPNDGVLSLREAISAADWGDVIQFDQGLSGKSITLNGEELLIDKSLDIQGPGAGQLTISGAGASRVFEIDNTNYGFPEYQPDVSISGLTITGGNSVPEVVLWDAHRYEGGGILNDGGKLTISDCNITGNHGAYGAGVCNDSSGTLTINNCTISGNLGAWEGGAIANYSGTVTVSGSTLSNNPASAGGGIYNTGAMTIIGSTLSNNSASDGSGGGIYNRGTMTLSASTVTKNFAKYRGGGIYNASTGTLTLQDTTVKDNSIAGNGNSGANIANDGKLIKH